MASRTGGFLLLLAAVIPRRQLILLGAVTTGPMGILSSANSANYQPCESVQTANIRGWSPHVQMWNGCWSTAGGCPLWLPRSAPSLPPARPVPCLTSRPDAVSACAFSAGCQTGEEERSAASARRQCTSPRRCNAKAAASTSPASCAVSTSPSLAPPAPLPGSPLAGRPVMSCLWAV